MGPKSPDIQGFLSENLKEIEGKKPCLEIFLPTSLPYTFLSCTFLSLKSALCILLRHKNRQVKAMVHSTAAGVEGRQRVKKEGAELRLNL